MMVYIKRWINLLMIALLVAGVLCGCGQQESPVEDFEYEFDDGDAIIIAYIGTDRDIVIPSKIKDRPVTIIGESAFEDYDLESVVLPDSVIMIGESAFKDCVCLEKVILSDSLEYIDGWAFDGCESLAQIDLPDSLKYLGGYAFGSCDSLDQLELPDDVKLETFVGYISLTQAAEQIYSPVSANTTLIVSAGSNVLKQIEMFRDYVYGDLNYSIK